MDHVTGNETVTVHYTGKLANGQVFDSSLDREPLEIKLGEGRLIPGFEKGLLNMKVNEKKTITIKKEEAYGDVRDDLFQKIDRSLLPQDVEPQVGMALISQNQDGTEQPLKITEVEKDFVVVDANHPLAGEDLTFELELLKIQ